MKIKSSDNPLVEALSFSQEDVLHIEGTVVSHVGGTLLLHVDVQECKCLSMYLFIYVDIYVMNSVNATRLIQIKYAQMLQYWCNFITPIWSWQNLYKTRLYIFVYECVGMWWLTKKNYEQILQHWSSVTALRWEWQNYTNKSALIVHADVMWQNCHKCNNTYIEQYCSS